MACWVAVAGDDAAWPAELEPACFPEPWAGWPTRNVPWRQAWKGGNSTTHYFKGNCHCLNSAG